MSQRYEKGGPMYTVSNIYRGQFGSLNYVRYLRIEHEETGEQRLIEPYEVRRAETLTEGDSIDYKVRLSSVSS